MIRVLLILLALAAPVAAQVVDPSAPSTPSGAISTQDNRATDLAILSRFPASSRKSLNSMASVPVSMRGS